MALKSWQTNKKNNAPQKKGHGKQKQVANKPANEKKAQRTAQDAKLRPQVDAAPGATPTPVTTEHAEPHASEAHAGEIEVAYEPTDTDVATASTPDLPAEEVEIEPVSLEAEQTALAGEPEVEAAPAEFVPAAQTETAESTPAQPEAAATASGAEAQVMAVAPEETQAAGVMVAPEEEQAAAQAPEETQAAEAALAEPSSVEPAPAEHAPIGEIATEQPAAATESTSSTNAATENEPTPASEKTQPRGCDPRLPPPGTVLLRRDRHGNVRCECTVEQDGIRYAGKLYKSLSAAAIAATKDMGLKSKTQNGHTFWGIAKPARPAKSLLESLERAWEHYRERAEAVAVQNGDAEERTRVRQAIEKHVAMLSGLRARVA